MKSIRMLDFCSLWSDGELYYIKDNNGKILETLDYLDEAFDSLDFYNLTEILKNVRKYYGE